MNLLQQFDKKAVELIQKYMNYIDADNYVDLIAEAAEAGVKVLLEVRSILEGADIVANFDKQLAQMLVSYGKISKILK